MSSPNFEHVKNDNPELALRLDNLVAYVDKQTYLGHEFVIPKLIGAALQMSDGEAYVLLELLVKAGILERVFNVYCKDRGVLLATVTNEEELDDIPYCDHCDREHDPNQLRLETAYKMVSDNADLREAA